MDEATRVLRATHAFGVLGDVVVRTPPSDTRVQNASISTRVILAHNELDERVYAYRPKQLDMEL